MFTSPSRHEAALEPRWTFVFAGTLMFSLILATAAFGATKSAKEGRPEAAKAATSPAKAAPAPAAAKVGLPGATGEHPSFSVDMVMKHDGETYTVRRTVDGPRSRMDVHTQEAEMVQILLGDEAGTTYTLMPGEKRAIKQSLAGAMANMPKSAVKEEEPKAEPAKPDVESLGKETVNGRTADKYRVRAGEGTGLMWIDAENNLPLRMEAEGSVVDFKNYQFGPQKPEVFEVPKGYEVMDLDEMMAKMPKGGMGMGGAPGMGSMAGGMARGMAGTMGGGLGGSFGGMLGGSLGGPIGSMIGQYVGQKVGSKIGGAAAGAVLPGK